MVDFSAVSTNSCLLSILQEESACSSSVAVKAYMHNEASTCSLDIYTGRETNGTEVGRRCARSRAHGRSRGQYISEEY